MVNRCQVGIFTVHKCSVLPGNPIIGPDDPLGRDSPQTDDNPRLYQPGLILQVRHALFLLLRFRVPVARGMAFYHIGKINLLPAHSRPGKQLVQQFPGPAGKGDTVHVLMVPRRFRHKHNRRLWIPFSHNRPTSRRCQRTALTVYHKFPQFLVGVHFLLPDRYRPSLSPSYVIPIFIASTVGYHCINSFQDL